MKYIVNEAFCTDTSMGHNFYGPYETAKEAENVAYALYNKACVSTRYGNWEPYMYNTASHLGLYMPKAWHTAPEHYITWEINPIVILEDVQA